MKKILMLHGINHNMFGKRDPVQYGTITLAETMPGCRLSAPSLACRWSHSRRTVKGQCASAFTEPSRSAVTPC